MGIPLMFWFWLLTTGSRKKALTYEAERLMRKGDFQQALNYYDAIAGEWPGDPSGFEGISMVYRQVGNHAEADRMENIANCLKEVEDHSDDPAMLLKTAEAFVSAKLYNLALTYADRAIRLAPENLEVLKHSALIFRHNRQYGKALGAIKQGLRLAPLDHTLYEQMAINLKGMGRKDDSKRALGLSRSLAKVAENPQSAEAMEAVIFHFTMAGAQNLGIQLLETALAEHPDNFDLNLLRGKLYLDAQNLDKAKQLLLKAVALNPLSQDAHFLLSRVYSMHNDSAKSRIHQDMAETLNSAKLNSDKMEGGLLIVSGLLKCGLPDNARQMANDLSQSAPQDWRGPYAIGLVDRAQGKLGEAIGRMQQASKMSPKAAPPLLEAAWILIQAKKNDAGVEMARKAVSTSPRNPDLRRDLAKVLRATGHVEQALEEEDMAKNFSRRMDAGSIYD